ncbi:hypothetical protein QYE80_26535 [Pseudomonas tohonis]|nr:hypothetical protein L682_17240 [Pseudomonas alcaligenes OT 69]MDN4148562.1 hypothetical protein [Pseudomonas tohonis]
MVSYYAEALYATHLQTAGLRGIRMEGVEWFEPEEMCLMVGLQ